MSAPAPRVKYVTNKDLLREIHLSKASYSTFEKPEYATYDLIVADISKINIRTVAEAKRNRAIRLAKEDYEKQQLTDDTISLKDCEIDYKKISKYDVVFRIMTYDHVPLAPGRKKTVKNTADKHRKVNFPPFQHWKYDENDNLICVGKSHWKGDLESGEYCDTHGKITNNLARMFMKLCERYATRKNVHGYSYNDEMKAQSILQLSMIGLKFDESKSDNPFCYYSAIIGNSMIRVLKTEKRNQNIRDDLLEMHGLNPSWTRTNSYGYDHNQDHD